jgi:hypothetical protein
MNIFAKECLVKWPDQEEAIASLDARITARWKEGETKGTGHGYFTLIRGKVPSMHEVRDQTLQLHVTDRKGPKYVADVTVRSVQPIQHPGREVDLIIKSIEEVT